MQSKATTVSEYLAGLPEDRRKAIGAIRKVIKANLGKGFGEGMQYGMIGYFVPHSVYPDGYHCDPKQPLPFASLASQKNHIGIYLFCIYVNEKETERFVKAWRASGKKLDMGKSCVRVKSLEDVPLDVLGDTIKRITAKAFIESYENGLHGPKTKKKAAAKKAGKKTAGAKKSPAKKKVAVKKAPTKKKATRKSPKRG